MSKKANKTLIGAFVIGAIALVVVAIFVLGSGKFFKKTFKVVMFFDGSIKGLNIGAPVIFKGVRIGSVTNIRLVYNPEDKSLRIPITAELEPESVAWTTGIPKREPDKNIKVLVERGLRAQLQMQSIVTGQLIVTLDFFPEKPIRTVGIVSECLEIPTVPTSFEELTKSIQELPLKEIVAKIDHIAEGIDKLVNSPDVRKSVKSLSLTLRDARKLIKHIDEQVNPHTSTLLKMVEALNGLIVQTGETLNTFSEDSRLVYESNRMLRELNTAARSVRILSEYLEQHPEALLTGKKRE